MTSEGDPDAPGRVIGMAEAIRQLLALAPGLEEEFRTYLNDWMRDAPPSDLSEPGLYNVWGGTSWPHASLDRRSRRRPPTT